MLPSLWTPTALCGGSREDQSVLDEQPRSVLLDQPQHQQDVPDIQGEQCLPHLIFLSSTFFQPTGFIQLQHEKRFKFLLILIHVLITIYVVLFFVLAQIIVPGVVFRRVYFFTSGVLVERDDSLARLTAIFFVYSAGLTVLAMLTSEI